MTCCQARLLVGVVAALCCLLAVDAQEVNCSVPADGALPSTPEEITEYIQCCRDAGELAAVAASIAACSELANKCPPPQNVTRIVGFATPEEFVPTPAEELLKMALEESCVISVKESCKGIARDLTLEPFFTSLYNTSCSDTLIFGPDISVIGCENLTVANMLFEAAITQICETDVDLDDVMTSIQNEGGR